MAHKYPHDSFTFFPQAFHPAYGNMQSASPPQFLVPLTTAMASNASLRNNGANVLSFGFFQGYNNIKRQVRHSPKDLLATKLYATGALTIPEADAKANERASKQRQKLINCIRGEKKPSDRAAAIPFARERRQIDAAIAQK